MTFEKKRPRLGGPCIWSGLSGLLVLGGCATAPPAHGPSVKLCEATKLNGWHGENNQNQWFLKSGDNNYVFSAADKGSRNDIEGPVKNVHWVMLDALSVGRSTSKRVPTMLYSPVGAVLQVDGKDIRALPHLWTADFVKDRFQPGRQLPVPHDLNAGGSTSKRYYMAFPVHIGAQDTYRLLPGSIALDGQRVALPVLGSCAS
jgi:hypothetical protein